MPSDYAIMILLFKILINVLSYARIKIMKKPDRDSPEYRLGQRIAVLRENARMTQEQLAEESQLTRAYIGRIELGIVCPSIRTLMKIASGLGLGGVSYFFVPKTNQEIERCLVRFDFRQ